MRAASNDKKVENIYEAEAPFVVVGNISGRGTRKAAAGKAKLPGTCLFVDDKNHRERGREEERGNPSGTLEMDRVGDVLCYSLYRFIGIFH